jgi:hypothetical protein
MEYENTIDALERVSGAERQARARDDGRVSDQADAIAREAMLMAAANAMHDAAFGYVLALLRDRAAAAERALNAARDAYKAAKRGAKADARFDLEAALLTWQAQELAVDVTERALAETRE